jgi:hypothetical protein
VSYRQRKNHRGETAWAAKASAFHLQNTGIEEDDWSDGPRYSRGKQRQAPRCRMAVNSCRARSSFPGSGSGASAVTSTWFDRSRPYGVNEVRTAVPVCRSRLASRAMPVFSSPSFRLGWRVVRCLSFPLSPLSFRLSPARRAWVYNHEEQDHGARITTIEDPTKWRRRARVR